MQPRRAPPATEAQFIDAPRDDDLRALYDYWDRVRGDRSMPQRADIDPSAIPRLLPFIILYTVPAAPGSEYTTRLVGDEIVRFVGQNTRGRPAGSTMTPQAAAVMVEILDVVVRDRVPKFRAGKAHWQADKTYRDFEACFLPLSADGATVNIILGGVKFPV